MLGANRDEQLDRPWDAPAEWWPGITGGRDRTAGGTWMALNRHGVMAAILNRHGTLGPAAGKRSRGELPLLALGEATAEGAAARIAQTVDGAAYRPFNLVIADAFCAFFIRWSGDEPLSVTPLSKTTTMLTAGEPNDLAEPRIARHLPKFRSTPWESWGELLADNTPPAQTALNIPPLHGFGTVCSSLLALPTTSSPTWLSAPGPPDENPFRPVSLT